MSQRRMFSPDIVCSEEFCDMPPSTRELYFQLGMRADDDGFVQPKGVIRSLGAKEDDLKVLIAKRFVLPFESGVVVIKHWLIHNMIRTDRYKETRFLEEKRSLYLKENKAYTDNPDNGKALATKWQPNGNHPAPQVRLGKVSIISAARENVSSDGEETPERMVVLEGVTPSRKKRVDQHLLEGFSLWGKYPKVWEANVNQRESMQRLLDEHGGIEGVKGGIAFWQRHMKDKHCPSGSSPWALDNNWAKFVEFRERNGL